MANLNFLRGSYSNYVALKDGGNIIETNLYFTMPDAEPNTADTKSSSYCLFHGTTLLASATHEADLMKAIQDIAALEERIDNISSELATYEVSAITVSDANVKEAYAVIKTQGDVSEQVGSTIKIYKDSALQSVELSGQSLVFTYLTVSGGTEVVPVDVSSFLAESEFADGLDVSSGGVVSVNVADDKVNEEGEIVEKNFLYFEQDGDKQALAVRSIDTNKTVLEKPLVIAGLDGQFGAGNYSNNDVIPAGTDVYTILQNILCKELYANPSNVIGTITASIAKPVITLDKSSTQEVGTLVTMNSATVANSTIATTGHAVNGMEYGYSTANDNTQDSADKSISKSWSTAATGGSYKMVASLTGFNADTVTNQQNTPATVNAQTMSKTVLGCLAEGDNKITVSVTGDTFTCSIDGIDAVYHCSNLGNTNSGKVTTAIEAISDKVSNAPTNSDSKTVKAQYKYFLGYSTNTLYNQFDSASVRALAAKTNWVAIDGTTTIVDANGIQSDGKSIVIACPSKYKLATVQNGVGANILENFTTKGSQGVVSVKCGEINVDYNVYVYPITNNAVVEFKNVTLTKA